MSAPYTITIDGPAGVGKSTLAKRLAEDLGIAFLDTGAMFRTVALRLGPAGTERVTRAKGYDEQLEKLLDDCVFSLEGAGLATGLLCNGRLVGDEIRSEEAGMMAALIGGNQQVRDYLKAAQQRLGAAYSLVAEGRDMGTVVFPAALCKIFLEADPAIRAGRRFDQLRQMGKPCQFDALVEQIRERDEQDKNRAVAPLRPAADAVIIDTTHKDIDAVYKAIQDALTLARREAAPGRYLMRRKDRALEETQALDLLGRGEYGVLSMVDGCWPYGLPLSFVLLDDALYFHGAREGRKVDILTSNNRGCFTVVGMTQPVYDGGFSTCYESVMVFGRVTPVWEDEEKSRALYALAEKYLPEHMDKAEKYIAHSFKKTALYRIAIEEMSGKVRRPR